MFWPVSANFDGRRWEKYQEVPILVVRRGGGLFVLSSTVCGSDARCLGFGRFNSCGLRGSNFRYPRGLLVALCVVLD